MIGFTLILILFILGLVLLESLSNTKEIRENWPKHRCKISVMPFASVYGHNTQENFNFCMQTTLAVEAGPLFTPIFTIFGTLLSTISVIMNVMNSLRVSFATFMGGINLMFQNFTDRIKQLTYRLQMSTARMKSLMGRLYGTFFAIIYAGISGIQATNNFGNTFLFKFLDTFCFDPTTRVSIEGKGLIPIQRVEIGDIFEQTKSRVTGRFSFLGDGQQMVCLGGVTVSTNHFVLSPTGTWIRAEEHPDAVSCGVWSGGSASPLICLNTSDHQIPIASLRFRDYDETEDADSVTMQYIQNLINAGQTPAEKPPMSYSNVLDPSIPIAMKDGMKKELGQIQLGETVESGTVIGLVEKEVKEVVTLSTGEVVGAGLLTWRGTQWHRPCTFLESKQLETPVVFKNLICTPSAILFTDKGTGFRDYMELHSQDAEQFYDGALRST